MLLLYTPSSTQEREESVKVDIIGCFTELLRATVVVEGPAKFTNALGKSLNDTIGLGVGGVGASLPVGPLPKLNARDAVAAGLIKPPPLTRQRSCFDMLEVRPPELRARRCAGGPLPL